MLFIVMVVFFNIYSLFFFFISLFLSAISSFGNDLFPQLGCLKATIALHLALLQGIFRAPLTFFDTTPTGRILGRFSSDVFVLDSTIPRELSDTIYCIFEVIQKKNVL